MLRFHARPSSFAQRRTKGGGPADGIRDRNSLKSSSLAAAAVAATGIFNSSSAESGMHMSLQASQDAFARSATVCPGARSAGGKTVVISKTFPAYP